MFNLIKATWLPVRRLQGGRDFIRPSEVTRGFEDDPIVALDFPRPDFDAAVTEFLIGLLATAAAPADRYAWIDGWDRPPPPDALQAAFAPIAGAFDLDGPGPRFLQDLDPLAEAKEEVPVAALLIDAPGANAVLNNTDLFVKRGGVPTLGPALAATALVTLQTYAPAGGAGHRVSMRGGGPLTTLAVPSRMIRGDRITTLWDLLWANVPTLEDLGQDEPLTAWTGRHDVFPWLGPTRVSDKTGRITTPRDAHPLQAYWGMPRRIRLSFTPTEGAVCALGGPVDGTVVRSYRTRPYGVSYVGWVHPLSPHIQNRKGDPPWLPRHPNPGGITYRHWLGLTGLGGAGQREAETVGRFRRDRDPDIAPGPHRPVLRVHAFGFDMDNMKARAWYAEAVPLFIVPPDREKEVADRAEQFVKAAQAAANRTAFAVKLALHGVRDTQNDDDGAPAYKLPTDLPGNYDWIGEWFWRDTEAAFEHALHGIVAEPADADWSRRRAWREVLRHAALALFDAAVDLAALEDGAFRRIVHARSRLVRAFSDSKTSEIRKDLDLPIRARTETAAP